MQVTQYPKQKPFRSKKAIEWFRTQNCHISSINSQGYVTGHHEPLNGHGTSTKGPDDEQIPLIQLYHTERHSGIGREEFWGKYGVDDWRDLVKYYQSKVHKYLNGRKKK